MATASSSTGGTQRAWHVGKEVAERIFTAPPASPFLWTTCSFHSTSALYVPPLHTQVQDHDHCSCSRPSMQPLCFPFWWALWHFVTDFNRHWTRNLVEVITSAVWKREMLLSAVDHPSPLRQHVWHQNSHWIFHSTLQLGRLQHFCGWWYWHSLMNNISWQRGTHSFSDWVQCFPTPAASMLTFFHVRLQVGCFHLQGVLVLAAKAA